MTPAAWLRVAGRSAAVLAALTALVVGVRTEAADLAVLRAAQSVANGALDALANAHTLVGHAATTIGLAGALAYAGWRRGEGPAALAPLLIVLTAVVELGLKLTTGHAAPGPELSRSWLDTGEVPTPSSGFPSGHAARLSFLSLYLGALARDARLRAAAAVFVALSLFLRMYIGDHWPTEVLGGLALGAAAGALALAWRQSAASKSSFARRK